VLVPSIAFGLSEAETLVDVGRLASLGAVDDDPEGVTIGAAVTLARLADGGLPETDAALVEAARAAANPLVRRSATVGGNIATRLPALDLPPSLLVLDAEVVLAGSHDELRRPVAEVLDSGPGRRVITGVWIPRDGLRRSGFLKYAWRRATGTAVISVAMAVSVGDGRLARPRIAIGGLRPRATRLAGAEGELNGRRWDRHQTAAWAGRAAREAVTGLGDQSYRHGLVELAANELLNRLSRS